MDMKKKGRKTPARRAPVRKSGRRRPAPRQAARVSAWGRRAVLASEIVALASLTVFAVTLGLAAAFAGYAIAVRPLAAEVTAAVAAPVADALPVAAPPETPPPTAPATGPTFFLSPSEMKDGWTMVPAGQPITVIGSAPGSVTALLELTPTGTGTGYLGQVIGSGPVDADGSFSFTVTLPSGTLGQLDLTGIAADGTKAAGQSDNITAD